MLYCQEEQWWGTRKKVEKARSGGRCPCEMRGRTRARPHDRVMLGPQERAGSFPNSTSADARGL